jgi:uncharacterized protein (AIM24 family)
MRYTISGDTFQVLSITLSPDDKLVSENNNPRLSWLSPDINKKTFSTGKFGPYVDRVVYGSHKIFDVYQTAKAESVIAFSTTINSKIKVIDITPDNSFIIQKGSLIAMENTVKKSTFRTKNIIATMFGVNDIELDKLTGQGVAFVEIDNSSVEYNLNQNESLQFNKQAISIVSTSCKIKIRKTNIIKAFFLGDNEYIRYTITGPGLVIMQNAYRSV